MPVSEDFTGLTGRFRGELLAHCYRMLGSAAEAEDLVQETYLRAWRSYEGFEGRSSVRTWLYRIATNVCLTALERRGRRPLPSGLGGPAEDPEAPVVAGPEGPWLQPFPDALLAAAREDPAAVAGSRAGIRPALVSALPHPSAPQPAGPSLRDALEGPGAPVAARGQPAFAVGRGEPGGGYEAPAVLGLTVTGRGIARVVSFQNPGLFGSLGLPQEYRAAGPVPAEGPAVPPWPR